MSALKKKNIVFRQAIGGGAWIFSVFPHASNAQGFSQGLVVIGGVTSVAIKLFALLSVPCLPAKPGVGPDKHTQSRGKGTKRGGREVGGGKGGEGGGGKEKERKGGREKEKRKGVGGGKEEGGVRD